MGVFDSKPLNTTPLNGALRKNPLLFGVPFVMIMVVASYALVPFTQTKYELQDRRVSKVRLQPVFYHKNIEIYAVFSGLERARTRPGESKEKVRHPRGILCKCLPYSLTPIFLTDLPSVLRNSAQRRPKIGSPDASNVQPEHLNGAYHHLNRHRSGHDPL